MRQLALLGIGLALASGAWADGFSQLVMTSSGISVETSERNDPIPNRYRYPVYQLMDRNPRTTWVLQDPGYPKPRPNDHSGHPKQPYITFQNSMWDQDASFTADELRLRVGYHKSERLYRLNSRPLGIEIYDGHPWNGDGTKAKPIRKLKLKDKMDEKSIWLPKRKYSYLYVVFTDIKRGPIDDLCVSEMELRSGGRRLVRQDPYLYSTGSDCG